MKNESCYWEEDGVNEHIKTMTPTARTMYTKRDGKCVCCTCEGDILIGDQYVSRRSGDKRNPRCLPCALELGVVVE